MEARHWGGRACDNRSAALGLDGALRLGLFDLLLLGDEVDLAVLHRPLDQMRCIQGAAEDLLREGVLHLALDGPLEGTGAKVDVEALVDEEFEDIVT